MASSSSSSADSCPSSSINGRPLLAVYIPFELCLPLYLSPPHTPSWRSALFLPSCIQFTEITFLLSVPVNPLLPERFPRSLFLDAIFFRTIAFQSSTYTHPLYSAASDVLCARYKKSIQSHTKIVENVTCHFLTFNTPNLTHRHPRTAEHLVIWQWARCSDKIDTKWRCCLVVHHDY